ncbi:protein phosphatase 1 regulatory subunit 26 isoform X2 [Hypanus sabinus]|nr:protein phosphatase 1 regulatory subunit 26 isoform X2 [Hypanus sabinus]XP_059850226.1 protein phosphatase 1 regulatory subunit 26 isoform X2 [Hypanus sabinus]XP_059850227.1 protein phosphatase 1 regulatory subunit 26 isoform X2 [Hypanus sabinus]XP_059850228.1 protein phosphatase 1 regulatory subunit 26 isoform X2 [Hypanus sabinus]
MFLMNLTPASAIQTDWQSFGASQSYSLPVGFSSVKEKFSAVGSTVNVSVQMIVENLQPHNSSHAMNNDPSSNAQTNLVTKWRSEGALDNSAIKLLKGAAVEDLKTVYPTCALGTEESNLGHCELDTDSDESVDRDIEKAIQEYLKKKTEESCSMSNVIHDAEVPPVIHTPIKDAAPNVSNRFSLEEKVVPTELVNVDPLPTHPKAATDSRCSSPSSISSNDSFELSIQAEIERFLQDKRDKETSDPSDKLASKGGPAQKENLVKVGLKSKKRYIKASAGNQARVVKPLVTNPNTQVTGTKSTKVGEVGKSGKTNERNPKSHKKLAIERKPSAMPSFKDLCKNSNIQLNVKTEFSVPKPNSITTGAELSDSSSDDGIEEAIQRYQLEQKKIKDLPFALGLLPHKPLCSMNSESSLDARHAPKDEGKETTQATLSKKRKQCIPKSVESKAQYPHSLLHTVSSDQLSNDFVKQKERKHIVSELNLKRTETPSEFFRKQEGPLVLSVDEDGMLNREVHVACRKMTSKYATVNSQQISSSDSEDSSVDSSDSIEKEIQNYLALKVSQRNEKSNKVEAMSESVKVFPSDLKEEDSLNLFSPLSSSQMPLLQKESLKSNDSVGHKTGKEKLRESQPVASGAPVSRTDPDTAPSKIKLKKDLLEQDTLDISNVWDSKAINRNQGKLSPNWATSIQSCHKPVHDAWQTDDKSSSLDSDEDLDTATMDLLKTRKRVGRRSRDSKNWCRKRVRFTGAEVLTFSEQNTGIGNETPKATGEGLALSHAPLKSCLSKSSRTVCRSYLDFKSKNNKRAGETSEGEGNGSMVRMGRPISVLLSTTPSTVVEPVTQKTMTGDSSSGDSDDGIEQEILRFLAEKARGNSVAEESLKDQGEVQDFIERGERNRSLKVPGHGAEMSSISQQTEGSCSVGMKEPHHEEEAVTAGCSFGGMESAAAESKARIHDPGLLQDACVIHSAEHQTEHRPIVRELSTVFQTKTALEQGILQVGTTDCQGKESSISKCDLHSNVLQVDNPLGNCITQNVQDKQAAAGFKAIPPLVRELSGQCIDLREQGVRQPQPEAVQAMSLEGTVSKLKSCNVVFTEPLCDTVPKGGEKDSSSRAKYSMESQSHVGCSTEQSPRTAGETYSHLGWTGRDITKPEEGGYPSRPSASLMPSVSPDVHSSEMRGLPCGTWQEQSDHNYQCGMRHEMRSNQDAGPECFNFVRSHSCESRGASTSVPFAAHSIPSTHKETSRIDQSMQSTEPETAKGIVSGEGTSEEKASSQCSGKENGGTAQWQSLNLSLLETKNEEQSDRRRTGVGFEEKSPQPFYEKANDQSDNGDRMETGSSGQQGQYIDM